jgi:hypothetical protein
MNQFTITAEDDAKIHQWLVKEVYPPIVERQLQDPMIGGFIGTDAEGNRYPYEGAIGGGITYSFTPTSLGVVVKVKYGDKELDLTDYDMW